MQEEKTKVWMFIRTDATIQALNRLEDFFEQHAEVVRHEFKKFTQVFTRDPEFEPHLEVFMNRELTEVKARLVTSYCLPNSSLQPETSPETVVSH
jgi:hypothetical protein